MDLEKVFSLIDKAEKSSFNKIKIKMEDVSLCLERDPSAADDMGAISVLEPNVKVYKDNDEDIVYAPISGVFYVAKEPGAEPFVKEGSRVGKGDTICIIEAMKMMNEICAPKSGVIEHILKKDGQSITVKDALFKYAKGK
ncbi:MAG: hypothetical protein PHO15_05725 [Eubacteriales bacterium]|nr:hypothetical protein [Eubacteriales bacterium]